MEDDDYNDYDDDENNRMTVTRVTIIVNLCFS
jgi:hypothetical protein